MIHKFTRRSLIDSMSLFEKIMKNRSNDFDFSLKNKSNIVLFFFLYISDNMFNRLLLSRLIEKRKGKVEGYDQSIIYPPEGPVLDKDFMHRYRRKYFKSRKQLKYAFYLKDYLITKLNFISNYSFQFGDMFKTNRLSSGFNLLNDALSEKYIYLNNTSSRRISASETELLNHRYDIDDVTLMKFNRFISSNLKSTNFIKLISLLQNKLNFQFVSHFKSVYNMFINKNYLLINDYMDMLKDSKFNINFSYLEFTKLIFIKYIKLIMEVYGNSINKKKIMMIILDYYRFKKIEIKC